MNQNRFLCLQSLKDIIDEEVEIKNGKKKANKEVHRLTKTTITPRKSNCEKEEKVQEEKIQKAERSDQFNTTAKKTGNSRSIQPQTRILEVNKEMKRSSEQA